MDILNQWIANGVEIVKGRIIHIGEDGKLQVKTDTDGTRLTCDFLQTTDGPLPRLYLSTPVLCIAAGEKGYVLGVVQPYRVPETEKEETPPDMKLTAGDSIELTCGQSTLSMDKNGKIVLRGTDITTRSSGTNHIKGATIRLN